VEPRTGSASGRVGRRWLYIASCWGRVAAEVAAVAAAAVAAVVVAAVVAGSFLRENLSNTCLEVCCTRVVAD